MNSFKQELEIKLNQYQYNNFGQDNYDEFRFGNNPNVNDGSYMPPRGFIVDLKNTIKKIIGKKTNEPEFIVTEIEKKHIDGLQHIYNKLNTQGKALLLDLMAYRQLGFKKVKLARNTIKYWQDVELAKSLADQNDTIDPKFMHFMLQKHNLAKIGFDIKLYFMSMGVAIDYITEQYCYQLNGNRIIEVEKDDVVLDIGACWGDTAFYFANKVGDNGKVYSFEFIPGNIKLFNKNLDLNPHLKNNIVIVEHPVSNKSNDKIYYKDFGPGSEVVSHPFEGQTGSAVTLSIDDFVKENNIQRVDFIKMDIEGAEPYALQGALETIKKFRPKLAIAIYHSMDDFVNIPNWIIDLNLGYEIYIDHFTIHEEETVCFAKPKNR